MKILIQQGMKEFEEMLASTSLRERFWSLTRKWAIAQINLSHLLQ